MNKSNNRIFRVHDMILATRTGRLYEMKEFKDKLREKRCEAGLSQQHLAEKIFVSRSAVAKWENGLGYPSHDCREQIKALFEVGDDFFRAEEPEKILCEKNRKLRSLRVRGFVLSGLAMLVMILLLIILVAHMWGYRLTPDDLLYSGMEESHSVRFSQDEFIFDCIAWDIVDENDVPQGKMLDSINVIRKSGIFYRNELDNEEYVTRFWLEGPNNRKVAVLMRVRGEKADHWFVRWSSSLSTLDESGVQGKYRKITDRITVNGKETVLQYFSYFPMKEELVTIAIDGTEMYLKPYQ